MAACGTSNPAHADIESRIARDRSFSCFGCDKILRTVMALGFAQRLNGLISSNLSQQD